MNVIVLWLFLTVPCFGLQFVIVVFPGHTHLLFKHPNKDSIFQESDETYFLHI